MYSVYILVYLSRTMKKRYICRSRSSGERASVSQPDKYRYNDRCRVSISVCTRDFCALGCARKDEIVGFFSFVGGVNK